MKTTEMDAAIAAIGSAESLAITCHINPDGDALGSALALAHAARAVGVEAVVSFGGEFVVPESLQFLDLGPLVAVNEFPEEPECLVVFDVAAPDRLGEIAGNASRAGTVIVIDHHLSNDGFGDIAVIDSDAAASAQLATYLIEGLGWPIDETVALCLMTGLVTDTGRFQYSATTGEVMRIAGRLLDTGMRPEIIGQEVYESAPFGYLAVSAAVLGRAQLEAERGLVWSTLTLSDLEDAGMEYSQTEGLIDDLRIAREADAALLLKQTDSGWKGSMRSRGGTDVAAIAGLFGGGGHRNAAGFHAAGPVDAILRRVREALDA
jgi:bifunctional oligoribonuclease and PAP phosphatase NrnA